ncbi:MAG TPA: MarR family transcriptional regulator [Patescibacteria group bacterium]
MNNSSALIEKTFSFLRCIKERMSLQTDVMNLSMVQLHTLLYIKHNPSTPMKSIAEYLKVELPSATSILNNLVKLQYVKRNTDKDDRRLVLLTLTSKGETLLSDAMKERTKNMEKILSYLSEKDRQELLRIFDTLVIAMEKNNEK